MSARLVRSRVLETSTTTCETRQRLARAIGRPANLPDIEGVVVPRLRDAGHRKQANEIIAARAFGAVLDRARDAIAALTQAVEPGRGGVPVATLARDVPVRTRVVALQAAAKNFLSKAATAGVTEPGIVAFAHAILEADDLAVHPVSGRESRGVARPLERLRDSRSALPCSRQ